MIIPTSSRMDSVTLVAVTGSLIIACGVVIHLVRI